MTPETLEKITAFIRDSDLLHKEQKLDGLRTCFIKNHPLTLAGETLLLDGIAIDPSELENGYWL